MENQGYDWIPIRHALPEIGESVLLTDGNQILIGYRIMKDKDSWKWVPSGVGGREFDWDFDDYFADPNLTDWAYLPNLPKVFL